MTPDIERLVKELWQQVLAQEAYATAKMPASRLARFAVLLAEECVNVEDDTASGDYDYASGWSAHSLAIRAKFALSNDKPEAK